MAASACFNCSTLICAIDLAPAKIADERARFAGQALRLTFERSDALSDALGVAGFLGRYEDGPRQWQHNRSSAKVRVPRRSREAAKAGRCACLAEGAKRRRREVRRAAVAFEMLVENYTEWVA